MNEILIGKNLFQPSTAAGAVAHAGIAAGMTDMFLRASCGNHRDTIAGATGTGKMVSLTVVAEGFRRSGMPFSITRE